MRRRAILSDYLLFLTFHELRLHLAREAEFVHPGMVDLVYPSLVQKYEENDVVTEAANPVQGRHLYHKCKDIIDERVEEFVGQHTPRKMRDALQFVVDKQLRRHHDEAEGQQEPVQHVKNPRVPAFVFQVHKRIDCVSS